LPQLPQLPHFSGAFLAAPFAWDCNSKACIFTATSKAGLETLKVKLERIRVMVERRRDIGARIKKKKGPRPVFLQLLLQASFISTFAFDLAPLLFFFVLSTFAFG